MGYSIQFKVLFIDFGEVTDVSVVDAVFTPVYYTGLAKLMFKLFLFLLGFCYNWR